jgi:hypothetical protein
MRLVFLLLVLANVAFFTWSRYLAPGDAVADGVLAREHEPERLKIVPPGEPPLAPAVAPRAEAGACLEWGSFTPWDFSRAEKALEPLALGARLTQRRSEENAGWWVFIPSMGSRQGALKKAMELRALGVEDYFVVAEEGESRWALSLGVFRSEEAAHARLAGLRAQGVRSAVVGPREAAAVPKLWLQVRGIDAALESRLRDAVKGMEGSELRRCP